MKQLHSLKIYKTLLISLLLISIPKIGKGQTSQVTFTGQEVQRIAYVVDSLTLSLKYCQAINQVQDSTIIKYREKNNTYTSLIARQDSIISLTQSKLTLTQDQLSFCVRDTRKINATKFKQGLFTGLGIAVLTFLITR